MILGEEKLIKAIDQKRFPFLLAAALFGLSAIVILIASLTAVSDDSLWMIGGTELLIYVIANAICSLVAQRVERFIKYSLVAYMLHFVLLCALLLCITGFSSTVKEVVFPIYGALVVCFTLSLAIVVLIRQVLIMLKDE